LRRVSADVRLVRVHCEVVCRIVELQSQFCRVWHIVNVSRGGTSGIASNLLLNAVIHCSSQSRSFQHASRWVDLARGKFFRLIWRDLGGMVPSRPLSIRRVLSIQVAELEFEAVRGGNIGVPKAKTLLMWRLGKNNSGGVRVVSIIWCQFFWWAVQQTYQCMIIWTEPLTEWMSRVGRCSIAIIPIDLLDVSFGSAITTY
jgi:hypothetical protein